MEVASDQLGAVHGLKIFVVTESSFMYVFAIVNNKSNTSELQLAFSVDFDSRK